MAANWSTRPFRAATRTRSRRVSLRSRSQNDPHWRVPYLPIDPADLGRSYEAVIRVNSQSGKGGFAWVLEQDQGLKLPKKMQADFSPHVQHMADAVGSRTKRSAISGKPSSGAYHVQTADKHFQLVDYEERRGSDGTRLFTGTIAVEGREQTVSGRGNGLISSVLTTIEDAFGLSLEVVDYTEHALTTGRDSRAAAYLECRDAPGGRSGAAGSTKTSQRPASVQCSAPPIPRSNQISRRS